MKTPSSMQTAEEREYLYDAFISYRHSDINNTLAKALQRRLENYNIPAAVKKQSGRKRMGRIFLDRDELPTSADLGADIAHALENAEWLITVCTPELSLSKWCMKEIDTFIALGKRDKILTLLVSGEPEESFPPQLRFLTDDSGETVEIEPLAADVRAKSAGAMLRKLRTEKLRLLAPMLGVGFDDLKRRARDRAIKRGLLASVTAAVLLAGFSIYAVTQALTISKQNTEITNKNDKITEANKNLEAQIAETQISQSKFLTSLSKQEFDKGNEQGAVQLALAALPEDFDNPDRPVYGNAAAMLRSVELNDSYKVYKPVYMIYATEKSSAIETAPVFSPDGKYIGTIQEGTPRIAFYSAADGTKIENNGENALYLHQYNPDLMFYPDGKRGAPAVEWLCRRFSRRQGGHDLVGAVAVSLEERRCRDRRNL